MNVERCLAAVEGYLQLEMPDEAMDELNELPANKRESVHAMELALAGEMMRGGWNRAVELAQSLCKRKPSKKSYFLHAAYCLHETGDTEAARAWLMKGPKGLVKDALFHYNMGCYNAVLGEPEEAKRCLKRAFELDPELRETAMADGDLAGLMIF